MHIVMVWIVLQKTLRVMTLWLYTYKFCLSSLPIWKLLPIISITCKMYALELWKQKYLTIKFIMNEYTIQISKL